MAEFRLHCFAESGNAYKPALLLELCGADWEPVFVDFFNGETRTPEYRELNEMGEVPVLAHNGTLFYQSGVILDYLSGQLQRFTPQSDRDSVEILRWLLWDNHKLTSNLATGRFLMNFAPEEKRDKAVIDFLMGRARGALKVLDHRLSKRSWIVGGEPSIADLSCVGYLYFTDEMDIDLDEYPGVKAWVERIASLPGWKHPYELMPGHERYKARKSA